MLIALLVVLGVDLIVIVSFVTVVVGRRRWLKRQPGHFVGAVRVTTGQVDGMPLTWKRGSLRWVRDVLVWSKAPFMFRTQVVPIDRCTSVDTKADSDVKRLGDRPHVATFVAGDVTIEVAAREGQRAALLGPFAAPAEHELLRAELET
jgi:hypothetical protein